MARLAIADTPGFELSDIEISRQGKSYSIDTVLFTAALMLTAVTRQYPFVDAWLTMKVVVMLPLYIFLGYWALRAKAFKLRLAAMAGAIAAFLFIYSIARKHSPLGMFALG